MEPLLEFFAAWWWAAPTTVGLGAVGYAGLTTGRRRARRLALDAARHEEGAASRALMSARAQTRSAQAQVLTAQAGNGRSAPGAPSVAEARHQLMLARQAQKSASLELKASRSRVRAERSRLAAASGADETPLVRLVHEHDAILARWLEYETDVELTIAFPRMSDPRDPLTAAFLHAQRDAQLLRPSTPAARMAPEEFVDYRASVRALEVAFTRAEDAALRASAARGGGSRTPTNPLPSTAEQLAARATERVTAWVTEGVSTWAATRSNPASPRDRRADAPPTGRKTDAGAPASVPPESPPAAAPADSDSVHPLPEPLRQPVWPVPGRGSNPPKTR